MVLGVIFLWMRGRHDSYRHGSDGWMLDEKEWGVWHLLVLQSLFNDHSHMRHEMQFEIVEFLLFFAARP